MGGIISRFRKKKSTLEILESLETELKSIESYSRETEQRHKTIVGHLLLFSVGAYVMVAGFFYFFFFPASLYDQLLYVVPLLLFPLIIVFLKRGISWWYRRKISKNQDKYKDIQTQKKQLLEEVMDKETYKVARQILEKFAPDQLRKGPNLGMTSSYTRSGSDSGQYGKTPSRMLTPMNMRPSASSAGSELRYRPVSANSPGNMSVSPVSRTMTSRTPASSPLSTSPLQSPVSAPLLPSGIPPVQSTLTRPILSVNRSILDRLVEYLVGDGVNHRYALICRYCNSHNGMALKEEFEFLAFRCCYCYHWNPARKQRLQAPKLETLLSEQENSGSSEESPHQSDEDEERRKSDALGQQISKSQGSSARNSLSESEKSEPCTDLAEERNNLHKTVTNESYLTAEKSESGSGDSDTGKATETETAH